jgi:Protein of unknown function (DUF2892)
MNIERWLRLIAGVVVTSSVILGMLADHRWLYLTVFAGLNLLQSGFTNWCPMVWILQKLGVKPAGQI